eukprot:759713-Hanusia_phi.AAC.3
MLCLEGFGTRRRSLARTETRESGDSTCDSRTRSARREANLCRDDRTSSASSSLPTKANMSSGGGGDSLVTFPQHHSTSQRQWLSETLSFCSDTLSLTSLLCPDFSASLCAARSMLGSDPRGPPPFSSTAIASDVLPARKKHCTSSAHFLPLLVFAPSPVPRRLAGEQPGGLVPSRTRAAELPAEMGRSDNEQGRWHRGTCRLDDRRR